MALRPLSTVQEPQFHRLSNIGIQQARGSGDPMVERVAESPGSSRNDRANSVIDECVVAE